MSLLTKFLKKKLGVESYTDLTPEEKETYRAWEVALSGRKLTDKDVAEFLDSEFDDATGKVTNPNNSEREDTFLKMKIDFIRKVKLFLKSPEIEKQALEAQIKSEL